MGPWAVRTPSTPLRTITSPAQPRASTRKQRECHLLTARAVSLLPRTPQPRPQRATPKDPSPPSDHTTFGDSQKRGTHAEEGGGSTYVLRRVGVTLPEVWWYGTRRKAVPLAPPPTPCEPVVGRCGPRGTCLLFFRTLASSAAGVANARNGSQNLNIPPTRVCSPILRRAMRREGGNSPPATLAGPIEDSRMV